jgi:hypothetical protein
VIVRRNRSGETRTCEPGDGLMGERAQLSTRGFIRDQFHRSSQRSIAATKDDGKTTTNGREWTRIKAILFVSIGVHSRLKDPRKKNKNLNYSSAKTRRTLRTGR